MMLPEIDHFHSLNKDMTAVNRPKYRNALP